MCSQATERQFPECRTPVGKRLKNFDRKFGGWETAAPALGNLAGKSTLRQCRTLRNFAPYVR
jgi:hypothetical protein